MASEAFDGSISELADAFGRVAETMLTVILSFLRGHASFEEAEAVLDEATDALKAASESWVQETLPEIYAAGAKEALDSPQTPEVDASALADGLHDRSLELFQASLAGRLASATDNVAEDAKAQIREIAQRRISEAVSGGVIRAAQAMEQEMRDRGLVFTDKGGRQWKPENYAALTVRTASAEVLNAGHINTAAELGSKYVRVSDGKSDSDEPCRRADGQVWSLSYAMAHRIEHPGCKRSFAALASTWSGSPDRG